MLEPLPPIPTTQVSCYHHILMFHDRTSFHQTTIQGSLNLGGFFFASHIQPVAGFLSLNSLLIGLWQATLRWELDGKPVMLLTSVGTCTSQIQPVSGFATSSLPSDWNYEKRPPGPSPGRGRAATTPRRSSTLTPPAAWPGPEGKPAKPLVWSSHKRTRNRDYLWRQTQRNPPPRANAIRFSPIACFQLRTPSLETNDFDHM